MLLELVMIVKNSGNLLKNCLNSIKPYIDSYTILDTGSTDGTQALIRDVMKDVSGNLYEEPFVDFSTSRNRALDLAGDKCKYTIMLDDTYCIKDGDNIRSVLEREYTDENNIGFLIKISNRHNYEYYSTRILKTKNSIRYIHKIHEIPDCDDSRVKQLDDFSIFDETNLYMKMRSKKRLIKDIEWLEYEHSQDPENPRHIYYLGKLNIEYKRYREGVKYLDEYIEKINGNTEGKFNALYLKAVTIDRELEYPWNDVEKILLRLCRLYPNRAEPFFYMGYHFSVLNRHIKAYEWLVKAMRIPKPQQLLGLEADIYNKEIPYMLANSAILTKRFELAEKILRELYKYAHNDSRLYNMIYSVADIPKTPGIRFEKPSVVFHATDVVRGWSPENIKGIGDITGSGSEVMTCNLAKEISKLGYRVFVFGAFNCEDTHNINTEGVYDGVQYIDCKHYFEFIHKYHIDYLIVSRDVTNIYYLDSIDNVYLWVHDIVPGAASSTNNKSIQIHGKKFKKILCLCKWHKNFIRKTYKLPNTKSLDITRNAIDYSRFCKDVERQPYRFIYASGADRGLEYLVYMFEKIKKIYIQAELHIFSNIDILSNSARKLIQDNDYFILHDKVSQDQIAIEFLKSDVFLYPTDFQETYCITALEAQAAGLLCVTTDIGALPEIIGDRGVIVKGNINEESVQDEMIKRLRFTMDNQEIKTRLCQKAVEWAKQQTYTHLAREWRDKYLS